MLDHVFVDAKTRDGSTDVAIIRTDRKGTVRVSYSDKVTATLPFGVIANSIRNVILANHFSEKFIVVAHFADVDRSVLRKETDAIASKELFEGRGWIDTSQMSWPLVYSGLLPNRTLDSVSKYMGVVNEAPNTAQGDVHTVMRLYWEMMRRYKTALTAEDAIRSVGGEKFDSLRKMVGL
jgi:DNA polymerase III epsilon subunit-like protein